MSAFYRRQASFFTLSSLSLCPFNRYAILPGAISQSLGRKTRPYALNNISLTLPFTHRGDITCAREAVEELRRETLKASKGVASSANFNQTDPHTTLRREHYHPLTTAAEQSVRTSRG